MVSELHVKNSTVFIFFCRVVFGPEKMITVPPRHYCIIENPVMKDKEGQVVLDKSGQAKLLHADQEIRLAQDPFPLYPGEVLKQVLVNLFVNSTLQVGTCKFAHVLVCHCW